MNLSLINMTLIKIYKIFLGILFKNTPKFKMYGSYTAVIESVL